jgi:hypothetical protein
MFKIAEFQAAQLELSKRVTALEEMRNDPELKRELEFDGELVELLGKYSLTKDKLYAFMHAQYSAKKAADKKSAGPKGKAHVGTMKRWSNPHSGEVIDSGRRDHKTIKGWIEQYGLKTVLTWATPI